MWPVDMLDDEAKKRRAMAARDACTTSHWPDAREVMKHTPHFQRGKVPPGLLKPGEDRPGVQRPPLDRMSDDALRLAGLLDYKV